MKSQNETSTTRQIPAQCFCGAVEFSVDDEFRYSLICHCSKCRQATGSAFKPFGGIEPSKLRFNQGANHLMIFGDENAHDARCKTCGSLLYSLVQEGKMLHVPYGPLKESPSLLPQAHIFVESKASWDVIQDSLPQFAKFPIAAKF